MLIDLNNLDNFRNNSQIVPILNLSSIYQIKANIINNNNILHKLCTLYMRNKLTWVIKRDKNMILTINILERYRPFIYKEKLTL